MIRRFWKSLQKQSRRIGTALTLIALIGVGYLGHHTGWFSSVAHDDVHEHSAAASPAIEDSHNSAVVIFRSAEAVIESGITTIKAERRSVSEDLLANGVVGYDQKSVARLSSLVPGTVWRVEKFWGDAVEPGDVLAIIEAAEVGRMKSEFLTAVLATESNSETLKNLEASKDAIPQKQVRLARFALRESRIRLLNAEQALVNLGLTLRLEDFEGLPDIKQAELLHFIGLPLTITASLDPDKTTSNLVPIIAPFGGVVINRDVGRGEVVEPAKPLMQIADIRRMWINLQVQKEDAPKVAIGQEVFFWVDGLGEKLQSQISWISTEVNQETRTLEVRAEVENKITHPSDPSAAGQRLLRANTFGTGIIRLQTKSEAIVVPNECVHTVDQDQVVFVRTSDKVFEIRKVQCGINTGKYTEIKGNVSAGEDVADNGSHILKSQMLLTKLQSQSP